MANMINHLQKALRHHVPMIRFKYGLNQAGAHSSTHTLSGSKHESNLSDNVDVASSTTTTTTKQSKSIQKSVSLEFSQTPNKYRRRPLTQDEIDLVTVGGFT